MGGCEGVGGSHWPGHALRFFTSNRVACMQTCKLSYKESYIECTHHVYPPSPPRKVHGTVEQIAYVVANRWLCLVVSVFPCM